MKINDPAHNLINGKTVFKISLLVASLTIIGVYFWGLGQHNTFFENSIISTTILSIAFFLFITIGLYKGMKLHDNPGRIRSEGFELDDISNLTHNVRPHDFDNVVPDVDADDGCIGVIVAIVLWIVWAIVVVVASWIFSNVVLGVIFTFAAMLYWIFFRALRLVFNNSNKSKGDIFESIRHGVTYTVLYNCWIYGVLLLAEYVKR